MKSILILSNLIFFSCTNVSKDVKQNLCFVNKFSQKIEKVSLKDIDKIKSLNGQFIQVEGYLTYEFENVALYPYKWSESDKSL